MNAGPIELTQALAAELTAAGWSADFDAFLPCIHIDIDDDDNKVDHLLVTFAHPGDPDLPEGTHGFEVCAYPDGPGADEPVWGVVLPAADFLPSLTLWNEVGMPVESINRIPAYVAAGPDTPDPDDRSDLIEAFAEAGLLPADEFGGWVADRYEAAGLHTDGGWILVNTDDATILLFKATRSGVIEADARFSDCPRGRAMFVAAVEALTTDRPG